MLNRYKYDYKNGGEQILPVVAEKADIRTLSNHIRATKNNDNEHVIEGKAIVFNEQSEYMGFYEIIKPEAVENIDWSKTLLLYDHEFSNILARVDAKNLTINVKEDGVYFQATLNNSTLANDVYNDIQSGNVKGCSFGFNIAKGGDKWDTLQDGTPLHIINQIESICELSLTPIPAYTQTSASVVRHLENIKEVRKMAKKDIKEEKQVEESKADTKKEEKDKDKEPKKVAKDIKTKVDVGTEGLMNAIKSVKDLIEEAKALKEGSDKAKEEKVEEPKVKVKPKNAIKEDKEEKSKEPEKQEKGSENIGGTDDMAQVIKQSEENKKPEEVRNFEAFLKGEKRDVTGMTTSNGEAVLPSQVLNVLKQPNDPANLATYVNRVAVQAGTGKLPVLAKASAMLASAEELAKNPDIANATITKVPYDLKTLRGALPVSMEMVQDYPDITSILGQYVQDVKANTEQHEIGKVLQKATAKTAKSLDDIKGLYNSLINYGSDRMFVVTNSMFTQLDTMKDAEGRYLLKDDISVATGRTLFGAPLVVVADDVLGGGEKMFVGSVKSFVLEAVKGEVTVNWKDNDYFDQVLAVTIRMDVQPADTLAGYFVTFNPSAK